LSGVTAVRVPSRWQLPSAWRSTWLLTLVGFGGGQFLANLAGGSFVHPRLLFWFVLLGATGCALVSAAVVRSAFRSDHAELGALGTFFLTVSVLPLAHGLLTPTVLYSDNAATASTVFWAVPIAMLSGLGQLLPPLRRILLGPAWRVLSALQISAVCGLFALALLRPNALAMPRSTAVQAVVGVVSFAVCAALSLRHIRLAVIADHDGPGWVATGYVLSGSSAVVWLGAAPYSSGFWFAHFLDVTGVFCGTIYALRTYRVHSSMHDVTRPFRVTDPLDALELGLDPIVRRFVRDLETKDAITREHVVRTAELAFAVGRELGLPAQRLRVLGLGALLHDVGKLDIPLEILAKPSKLTDSEYAVMKTHATIGAALVSSSVALAGVADVVRSHHERVDGRGYPDGLVGDAIPLEARIVSACDAYDAMANTRQYRVGMGNDKAMAILREHAGAQWDERVVRAVLAVAEARAAHATPATTTLRDVGRETTTNASTASTPSTESTASSTSPSPWHSGPCGCLDGHQIETEIATAIDSGTGAVRPNDHRDDLVGTAR
jgi:putative nucleotidyltransferase with HDIG domain